MQISTIKQLVEQHDLQTLEQAEEDIAEQQDPPVEIPGEDNGERLTHAFAAKYIKQQMQEQDMDLQTALREYTQKVRKSID